MLLIHRTIIKELLIAFLLSVIFLNFTLMMEKLLRLSRMLAGVGVPVMDIVNLILYIQPSVFVLTTPMAMLLSVLLTYGRMNTDNEIIILRVSGMSFRGISLPVLYLGLACFFLGLLMSFYVGPRANTLLRERITYLLTTRASMAIEEGIFHTAFKGIVILVKEKPASDRLSGIFIVDERKKDELKVVTAEEGRLASDADSLVFSLVKGNVHIIKGKNMTEISFSKYRFKLNPTIEGAEKKSAEFTPFDLLREAQKQPDKKVHYLLDFHRRISMPAVCLIIILLGPPLSLLAGKSGRLGGLTLGLAVFVLYYLILLYGENLARSARIPHFAGAWISFAILGIFSLWIFERVNKKR
ncbi:MAG: LptF/LptG family permease [Nitrospirae bacterium]|nr:LptF/LptG family permease [Nitrospirota bacterium]